MVQTKGLECCIGKSNFGRPFESVCGSIQIHHKPEKDCSEEDNTKLQIGPSAKFEPFCRLEHLLFLKCFISKD